MTDCSKDIRRPRSEARGENPPWDHPHPWRRPQISEEWWETGRVHWAERDHEVHQPGCCEYLHRVLQMVYLQVSDSKVRWMLQKPCPGGHISLLWRVLLAAGYWLSHMCTCFLHSFPVSFAGWELSSWEASWSSLWKLEMTFSSLLKLLQISLYCVTLPVRLKCVVLL